MRLFLFFLLFFYSSLLSAASSQKEVTFRIIHTTDTHGALFPFDFINNTTTNHGLAQVYTYVKQQRAISGQRVVLLDGGDILQGQPTVYYANYIDSVGPHIIPRVMNFMEYDAAVPGNHDIEVGPDIYNQLASEFTFPWLAANIIDTLTGEPYFNPYHIIEHNGVRIAILGLTTPAIPQWLPKDLWPDMLFEDMVSSAATWVDRIIERESPHAIIGLFHSGHNGYDAGSITNGTPVENGSLLVAEQVPGFDLILMGHSHEPFDTTVVNTDAKQVRLVNPGSVAQGISDILLKANIDDKGELNSLSVEGGIKDMQNTMPDPAFSSQFSTYYQEVADFVDRRVGYLNKTITSRDAYFGPSEFVNIIHSVQMAASNAQVSFAAPLTLNANIEQGNIHVRDLFKIHPYDNLLYVINLTGQEIKDYLEYSKGLWFNTMHSEEDDLLRFSPRERNGNRNGNGNGHQSVNTQRELALEYSFYFFDTASGLRYVVDVSKPAGERVTILSMEDGTPFSLEESYRVAINSYRGSGGGGHLTLGANLTHKEINEQIIGVSSYDIRYYLMRWIEMIGRVSPENPKNWTLEPSDWVEQAAERDYQRLFGED